MCENSPPRVGTALSGYKEIDERIFVGKVVYSTGTPIGRNSNYSKGLPGTNNGMWARSAHNLPRSGGSKPEGLARGCEAPERAKRAEPEGLVPHHSSPVTLEYGVLWPLTDILSE